MQEILNAFGITAPILSKEQLSGGRIHGTFLLRTVQGDYIAQKLHPTAFPDSEQLMHKLISVTDYLRPRCTTLHFYPTSDGGWLYQGWRLMDCIPGVTLTAPDLPAIAAAGRAFGAFQAALDGFTPDRPEPPFHDPARYFDALAKAAASDPCGRLAAAREVLGRLMNLRERACALQGAGLPVRTVHNDTKLSNLLFSPATGQPLAVIDLDTVGAGLAAYDFGDAVRSLHGAGERFEPERIRAFQDGFLEGAEHLTDAERRTLPLGITAITAELAARYLTDYLTGDRYFRCPDSLARAHQLTVLASSCRD